MSRSQSLHFSVAAANWLCRDCRCTACMSCFHWCCEKWEGIRATPFQIVLECCANLACTHAFARSSWDRHWCCSWNLEWNCTHLWCASARAPCIAHPCSDVAATAPVSDDEPEMPDFPVPGVGPLTLAHEAVPTDPVLNIAKPCEAYQAHPDSGGIPGFRSPRSAESLNIQLAFSPDEEPGSFSLTQEIHDKMQEIEQTAAVPTDPQPFAVDVPSHVIEVFRPDDVYPQKIRVQSDDTIGSIVVAEAKLLSLKAPIAHLTVVGTPLLARHHSTPLQRICLREMASYGTTDPKLLGLPVELLSHVPCKRIELLFHQEAWVAVDEVEHYLTMLRATGQTETFPPCVIPEHFLDEEVCSLLDNWYVECERKCGEAMQVATAILVQNHWFPVMFRGELSFSKFWPHRMGNPGSMLLQPPGLSSPRSHVILFGPSFATTVAFSALDGSRPKPCLTNRTLRRYPLTLKHQSPGVCCLSIICFVLSQANQLSLLANFTLEVLVLICGDNCCNFWVIMESLLPRFRAALMLYLRNWVVLLLLRHSAVRILGVTLKPWPIKPPQSCSLFLQVKCRQPLKPDCGMIVHLDPRNRRSPRLTDQPLSSNPRTFVFLVVSSSRVTRSDSVRLGFLTSTRTPVELWLCSLSRLCRIFVSPNQCRPLALHCWSWIMELLSCKELVTWSDSQRHVTIRGNPSSLLPKWCKSGQLRSQGIPQLKSLELMRWPTLWWKCSSSKMKLDKDGAISAHVRCNGLCNMCLTLTPLEMMLASWIAGIVSGSPTSLRKPNQLRLTSLPSLWDWRKLTWKPPLPNLAMDRCISNPALKTVGPTLMPTELFGLPSVRNPQHCLQCSRQVLGRVLFVQDIVLESGSIRRMQPLSIRHTDRRCRIWIRRSWRHTSLESGAMEPTKRAFPRFSPCGLGLRVLSSLKEGLQTTLAFCGKYRPLPRHSTMCTNLNMLMSSSQKLRRRFELAKLLRWMSKGPPKRWLRSPRLLLKPLLLILIRGSRGLIHGRTTITLPRLLALCLISKEHCKRSWPDWETFAASHREPHACWWPRLCHVQWRGWCTYWWPWSQTGTVGSPG